MTRGEAANPSVAQRQLPFLLVAVLVAVDLVMNPHGDRFPGFRASSFVGLCLGQIAVVSAWLVFGRLHFLVRLSGTLITIGCLSYPIAERTKPAPAEMMAALAMFVVAIGTPAAILRIRGVTIGSPKMPANSVTPERRWQFSIAALFVAMTSLGLILSSARLAKLPWESAGRIVAYCIGFTLVATVSLTAMRWRDRWTARLVACLLFAVLVGYGLAQVEKGLEGWNSSWITGCLLIALTESATICGLIAVIRISGYEVQRR